MLKIRVEGKENEINEFVGLVRKSEDFTVNSISRIYKNNTTMNIYRRCYIEIEFDENKGERYVGHSYLHE